MEPISQLFRACLSNSFFFPQSWENTERPNLAPGGVYVCVNLCTCVRACVVISGAASETVGHFRATLFWQVGGSWMDQSRLKGKINVGLYKALCTALAKAEVFTWFSEKFK